MHLKVETNKNKILKFVDGTFQNESWTRVSSRNLGKSRLDQLFAFDQHAVEGRTALLKGAKSWQTFVEARKSKYGNCHFGKYLHKLAPKSAAF